MLRLSRLAFIALILILTTGNLSATNFQWDPADTENSGGSGSWEFALASWETTTGTSNNVIWPNSNNDKTIFGGAAGTVSVDASIITNIIQFDSDLYTIAPGTGSLTLDGTTPTITVTNVLHTATVNAAINGTVGLTTGGAGTLNLSGANVFIGSLTVNVGTTILSGTANAAMGAVVVNNGGTLSTTAPANLHGAAADLSNVTVSAGGTLAARGNGTANIDTLNTSALINWAVGANLGIDATAAVTYANVIGDSNGGANARGLVKLGTATLTLNAVNTYSGGTTVAAGTLSLGAFASLGVDSGTNNISVAPGAILLLSAGTNVGGSQSITVNSTGTALGVIGVSYDGLPSLNATSSGVVAVNGPTFSAIADQAVYGNGAMFLGSTGTGEFTGISLGAGTGSTYRLGGGGGTLTIANTNILTGANQVVIGHTATNGGGTVVLSGVNDFSGALTVDGGLAELTAANNTNMSAVKIKSGAALSTNDPTNLHGAAGSLANVTVRAGGTLVARGTTVAATDTANLDTLNTNANIVWEVGANLGVDAPTGAPVTYSNAIGNSTAGSRGLVKLGADIAILSGVANTYTGTTTVSQGSLNVQHADSLGTTAAGTVVVSGATLQLQGGVTITGETLDLNGEGVANFGALRSISGKNTWAGTINANTSALLQIASDADLLTISGNIITNSNLERLVIQGSGATTVSGVISGPGHFTRSSGTGIVTLTGANTFTGQVAVSGGTISVATINSVSGGLATSHLGAPTTVPDGTIAMGGGRLLYTGVGETTDRVLNLSGSSIIDSSGTGPLVFTSSLTATAGAKTLTLQGSNLGLNRFQNAITDGGGGPVSLTKSGTGNWTLPVQATYTGSTTVNDGKLTLAGGANTIPISALAVSGTGILDLNGNNQSVAALTGSGTGTIINNGGDDLLLTLNNSVTGTYTGVIADGTTNKIAVTRTGSNTLTLGNGVADTNANTYTGLTTLTSGGLALNKANGTNAITGDITINDGTLSLAQSNQIANTSSVILTGGTFIFHNGGAGVFETIASMSVSNGALVHTTASSTSQNDIAITGALSVSGTSTFVVNSSSLVFANSVSLTNVPQNTIGDADPGFLIGSNGNRVSTLSVGNGGLSLANSVIAMGLSPNNNQGSTVVLNGNVTTTGTSAIAVNFGTTSVSLGGGTRIFDVTDTLAVGSPVTNGALTKTGTGTMTLSAAGTFSGNTTMSNGSLVIATALALQNSTLDFQAGTVTFATPTAATLGGLAGSQNLTLSNNTVAAVALTIGGNGATTTYSGILGGLGSLTKTGAGTLTLSAVQGYAGATTVSGGTLELTGGNNAIPATALTVTSPGILKLSGNQTTSSLSGSGTITNGGTSELLLTINNSMTTSFTGVISDGATNKIAFTRTGSGTFTLGGGAADVAPNTFTGLMTVTSGTMVLSKAAGTNAIAGIILINGGTLNWLRNNQIADSSNVALSSGALNFFTSGNGFSETFANFTQTGGVAQMTGSSTAQNEITITGTLSMSGATSAFTINSSAVVSANTVILNGIVANNGTGGALGLLIGSNSASRTTSLVVGSGGLSLTSSVISVGNGTASGGGSLVLNGDVTSTGTSSINVGATGTVSVDLGAGTSTFNPS